MGQTATLFEARRKALSNARSVGRGAFRPSVVAGVLGFGALVLVLGHFAAPSLLELPTDSATPNLGGRAPVAGDGALEAAFWLDALVCAFFSFRVMESLFRAPNVRALELLPVAPGPIFIERVFNAVSEGIALAAFVGLFFVPLLWHEAASVGLQCGLLGLGATFCTAAVTIGTNAWLGAQYGDASGLGDAYGGQGGAFIYAPVVSFAMSLVCLLLLQLGIREVLHEGQLTNAFWLAAGIAIGTASATLFAGGRQFVAAYHRVSAFFREADEVGFRAVLDYQESTWSPARGERLMAGAAGALYRRHVLQFARRYPVARTAAAVGSAAGVVACYGLSVEAFPNWAAAALPSVLIAVLVRPFGRIDDETLGGASDVLLPVNAQVIERARLGWTAYETLRIALPYALFGGVARAAAASPSDGIVVASGALIAAAVVAFVGLVRRAGWRGSAASSVAAVSGVLALGALLSWNPLAAVAGAALLSAAGVALFFASGERRT